MLGRIHRERCRNRKQEGPSVYRSPSSVTKEPRRDDDQGTVENCDEKMVRSATTDMCQGEREDDIPKKTKINQTSLHLFP